MNAFKSKMFVFNPFFMIICLLPIIDEFIVKLFVNVARITLKKKWQNNMKKEATNVAHHK